MSSTNKDRAGVSTAPAFRVERLLAPEAFPHPAPHLRLVETHVSWVILTGSLAYKIKKPVRFEFIDATTLGSRRTLCEEELRLNRRLAPDLYLDVVSITSESGQLRVGGRGPAVEYAVRMREFDVTEQLDQRVDAGTVAVADLVEIAATIADFHRSAAVSAHDCPYGGREDAWDQMFGNLSELLAHLPADEDTIVVERLTDWTYASLKALGELIERRRMLGAVRDCHGDLHTANLVRWRGRWTPFDCLEFAPRMRWIDVMSEAAFLYMDLLAHERPDLAFAFLSSYLESTGDYVGLRTLRLYAVYRALVRAKIDALEAGRPGAGDVSSLHARLAARVRLAARISMTDSGGLLITHGVTASGKSWLSEQLVSGLGAVRIRSDLERERLFGATREPGIGAGAYSPEASHRTYAYLLACADAALASGFTTIVDAAFLRAVDRDMFRALAVRRGVPFVLISCSADRATLETRLAAREREGQDPSQATPALLARQLETIEPLSPDERAACISADTQRLDVVRSTIDAVHARLMREPVLAAVSGAIAR